MAGFTAAISCGAIVASVSLLTDTAAVGTAGTVICASARARLVTVNTCPAGVALAHQCLKIAVAVLAVDTPALHTVSAAPAIIALADSTEEMIQVALAVTRALVLVLARSHPASGAVPARLALAKAVVALAVGRTAVEATPSFAELSSKQIVAEAGGVVADTVARTPLPFLTRPDAAIRAKKPGLTPALPSIFVARSVA